MTKMISIFVIGLIVQLGFALPTNFDMHPEINGPYYQGDIVGPVSRNGLIDEQYRWPKGEIPYEIVGTFTDEEIAIIHEAIDAYPKFTCLTVRPKTDKDTDYVSIQNFNSGCYSSVGRQGGKQVLNLESPGCVRIPGTCIHELMHAFGFYHEQSRFDRDDYVTIVWENILEGKEHNFDKYDEDYIGGFGQSYDYGSIMHYPKTAFTNNNEDTIVPMDPNATIGQRNGFSDIDIAKLNKMYENYCTKK